MAAFKHHSYFPKNTAEQTFRFPFVCFGCRKSFKFPATSEKRVCPQCRGQMEMLSRKFAAPKSRDIAQWRKIQFLEEHGFRFQRVYRIGHEHRGALSAQYPSTMEEARVFVKTFSQSGKSDA